MLKSKVAFLSTSPETVLEDYQRLFELAGGAQALQPGLTTILKDNISWHFPMPGANTSPWQLEGVILALRRAGYDVVTANSGRAALDIIDRGSCQLVITDWEMPEMTGLEL
ncbi:MAG TPA: response regulator, partial [Anaerolinea sp.]|nr:response regulator [Anaerolinea sp.]